eukprot:CAMPEP_0177767954 /NCGR_PEP_ID=MMETSP0491_2-20121128/9439_1 /TAXON_ID=63592 /ORGANISM="Tetraselmis chuii, Strain PLY429" /LENGTH=461 /DNA_ID=CAMNT_0019284681 /DNA_START=41 /DNA_END=1426 /DNA_ORIENTATION=-
MSAVAQSSSMRPCLVTPLRRTSGVRRSSRGVTVVRAALTKSPRDPSQRVVITGMGIASVFGNDHDKFYEALLSGTSGVKQIDRFDTEGFPTTFAAQITDFDCEGLVDRKSERRYDNCLKYTVVSGKKALIDAGLAPDSEAFGGLDKERCGLLIGTGMGGLTIFQDGVKDLVNKGPKKMSPFFIPYAITNMGSALLAIDLGFMGPNYSISTACATANYAFVAAANHIRAGEVDLMVAGGSEAPILPVGLGGFVACRALSTRNDDPQGASRPWDMDRDGFVMGEGAGVLVMESLEHAQKRGANIICEYMGGATNCDAHHMTDPRADGKGVAGCIKMALRNSDLDPEAIQYINPHATSTLVGDVAEVKAMKQAFPNFKGCMSATKSMIGHCLGAAAGLEAIATIKAITTGKVHPTLNQHNLIEELGDWNTVPNVMQEHDITAAMSNSFGFGGHNSSVVFAKFEE